MKKFLVFACATITTVVALAGTAYADVNEFVINKFNADYTLSREDPQGKLTVHERIDVVFSDRNHGILRAIPKSYKDHPLKVSPISAKKTDGSEWPMDIYSESGNLVLKIGDPNSTVTGPQTFIIDYTVQNVITFYDDHDELYWDINGDQWRQTFNNVNAAFHMPGGLDSDRQVCYTGGFGSVAQNCTITKNPDGSISSSTTQPLIGYQTLTNVMSFPKGYFRPSTLADNMRENLSAIIKVTLPPLLIGGWGFIRWLKYGRDLRGRGVIVPEYDPPDKLTPAEVGVLADYNLDNKDISATIIDLAVRNYINIIEVNKKKLIGSKTEYRLKLTNPDFSKLKDHEQTIINGLFSIPKAGEIVELKDLKTKFYTTVNSVRSDLLDSLTNLGYFPSNPAKAGTKLFIFAAIAGIPIFFFNLWLSIGFGLAVILLIIFGFLMPRRTAQGVAAKEHTEGLKLYLKTAEADRIKMLQGPNAKYAEKTNEPVKTVKLFEKLLPFAVLMGVEKEWAKQFEDIYTEPPNWYNGNWTTFNSVAFASSLNSSIGAMGSSFSAPSSSSGSGFSGGGGGFSGGGGGGGGGGGW